MKTKCRIGLDQLETYLKSKKFKKKRTGVLCHPSSVDSKRRHIVEILETHSQLSVFFGPQHGIFGETQDNMIEWQDTKDENDRPVYSLYGERREPLPEQVRGLDAVFVDLFDIGTRFYTFIYSMSYMLKVCAQEKIPVVICDRPNPLGGLDIEGPILNPEYKSFVGLHELSVCHAMSMGELALMFAKEYGGHDQLEILKVKNWSRAQRFDETGLEWTLPSPNMPNFKAAQLFPGMCLLEATSLSEGRGTTRPFELIGAPFINWDEIQKDYFRMCRELSLKPVHFHRQGFIPTFHKHAGQMCRGVLQQPPSRFQSFRHGVLILWLLRKHYGELWQWKKPPYEYEYKKWPIDILGGGPEIRESIDNQTSLKKLFQRWKVDEKRFKTIRKNFLLYRK